MENRRRLIRLNVGDFLEIRPVNEVGRVQTGQTKDLTLMGICFSSAMEWARGQVLLIDYFMPDELDSVKLKVIVIWSELISPEKGYFCGGEIIEVEEQKQEKFAGYYYRRLQERFLK